ncbi:MAG: peptidoglycan DD-metalloendopeptidase family protein [Flavobacteriaceae bacterium]|jgi:murein DD-endopeptidase MepM/ murein hydrolase activator NlpD|nr:peptidoglycan DD-metalloendopeptidase family protein [Flavobacteriaceae bacterium]
MRTKIITILLLNSYLVCFSQTMVGKGFNVEPTDCITDEQRTVIKEMIAENRAILKQQGKLTEDKTLAHPLFIWPVKKAAGTPYNEIWGISNYVDHDATGQIRDYNCGQKTYNGHAGVDIYTFPFGWYQMDNNQSEIVAAAPGVIVAKMDGQYDRRCQMSNLVWNAVYLQHADGSVTWYGHMKEGSLTTKNIGDSVAAGEFLGIVGSSGNSTGPHLHFEVYNSNNQLVDPYTAFVGPCYTSPSDTDSWWQTQKPYLNPKINAVLTHSAAISLDNGCGVQETTNFKDNFNTGETVYVYGYLTDIPVGEIFSIILTRPDNTVAAQASYTMDTLYGWSAWGWTFPEGYFDQTGTWKTTVTSGTKSLTHEFTYGVTAGTDSVLKETFQIINPVRNNQLEIIYSGEKFENEFSAELYSMDGKLISKSKINLRKGVNKLPFQHQKGNYILKISNKTFKILN